MAAFGGIFPQSGNMFNTLGKVFILHALYVTSRCFLSELVGEPKAAFPKGPLTILVLLIYLKIPTQFVHRQYNTTMARETVCRLFYLESSSPLVSKHTRRAFCSQNLFVARFCTDLRTSNAIISKAAASPNLL